MLGISLVHKRSARLEIQFLMTSIVNSCTMPRLCIYQDTCFETAIRLYQISLTYGKNSGWVLAR